MAATACFRVLSGAVATESGQCVLFPAATWQNRTALVAALSGSGFGYVSDEICPLISSSMHAPALPVPPAIRSEDLTLLSRYYPDLSTLPAHREQEGLEIRFLSRAIGVPAPRKAFPVRWIIFPNYVPGEKTIPAIHDQNRYIATTSKILSAPPSTRKTRCSRPCPLDSRGRLL